MSDWTNPAPMPIFITPFDVINTAGWSYGNENQIGIVAAGSANWTIANTAVCYAFAVTEPITIVELGWLVGATVTGGGTVVQGIYDSQGKLLATTGAQALGGASTIQSFSVGPLTLTPGLYYLAHGGTVTTNAQRYRAAPAGALNRARNTYSVSLSAGELPDPATFATNNSSYVPVIYASRKALV